MLYSACLTTDKAGAGERPTIVDDTVEYGAVRITMNEPGELHIDGTAIGSVKAGTHLVKNITAGKHKVEIYYDDHIEAKLVTILPDKIIPIEFYYSKQPVKTVVIEEDTNPVIETVEVDETVSMEDDGSRYDLGGVDLTPAQRKLLDKAYELLGRAPDANIMVNGKRFKLDCIGTVAAIFYAAGIDLQSKYARAPGRNGVSKFYNFLKSSESITDDKLPEVGDVVFWDNTWDYNGNGKFGDDPLTHVGIVTKIDPDGTVHYVHEHRLDGIVVERMNLYYPDVRYDAAGKELNSPMHANSNYNKRNNLPWLSGDLWRQCGGVLK